MLFFVCKLYFSGIKSQKSRKPFDKWEEKLYYCSSEVVQFERGAIILVCNLDKKRPVSPQLCEQICVWIVRGEPKLLYPVAEADAEIFTQMLQRPYQTENNE